MKRNEVEKIFQEHGLNDYRLTCIEDLTNCLGIDALKVNGYEDLTEENKEIYMNFIINFFNSMGMDRKIITVPKAINYVEDIDHVAQDPEDEECVVTVCNVINVIKANGKKKQLHKYVNKEYKDLVQIDHYRKEYLRFAFLEGKSKVWFHVTNSGKQWY